MMAVLTYIFHLLLLVVFTISQPSPSYLTRLIYQAPNGTWLDNLAIRSDGSILTTLVTSADVYEIQPSAAKPNPKLIHHFDDATAVIGITEETVPDSFQVATVNVSVKTVETVPGSIAVWRIRFSAQGKDAPEVTLTAHLPEVNFPNGLATLNDQVLLLADCFNGNIVTINTRTGVSKVVITDPILSPNSNFPIGINGLKVHHGVHKKLKATEESELSTTLFFTNSAQDIFGSIPIDSETGVQIGPASIIAHGLAGNGPGQTPQSLYDDFDIDSHAKTAYLATIGGNTILCADIANGHQEIIAGNLNSTEIAEPTAVRLAKGGKKMFVTTAGGMSVPVNGDEIVGGQLLEIDVPNQ